MGGVCKSYWAQDIESGRTLIRPLTNPICYSICLSCWKPLSNASFSWLSMHTWEGGNGEPVGGSVRVRKACWELEVTENQKTDGLYSTGFWMPANGSSLEGVYFLQIKTHPTIVPTNSESRWEQRAGRNTNILRETSSFQSLATSPSSSIHSVTEFRALRFLFCQRLIIWFSLRGRWKRG